MKLINGLGGLRVLIIAGFGNIIDKVIDIEVNITVIIVNFECFS